MFICQLSEYTNADLGSRRDQEPGYTLNELGTSITLQPPPMEVLSYGATSEHTAEGHRLASVNAARLVLSLFDKASSTQEALDAIRSQKFMEVRPPLNWCSTSGLMRR